MQEQPATHHRTITAILIEAGVVTDEHVQAGLARQRETGRRIGETLVELGFVSEEDIGWALARQLGVPFVDVNPESLDSALVKRLPEPALRRIQAVPLVFEDGHLMVATADPTDLDALSEVSRLADLPASFVAATRSAIETALDAVFGRRGQRRAIATAPGGPVEGGRFDVVWDRSGESFLHFHLAQARRYGAHEIQFVPLAGRVVVTHREGHRLVVRSHEPADVLDALLARLEALGAPPAPERDGHVVASVACEVAGSDQPLHVSTLRTGDGVSVTLRLLRDPGDRPRLDSLGMDPVNVAELRALLGEPSGLVLVSGPTASGCSTTLSALLAEVPTDERRWLVFARDRRRWPAVKGLVSVLAGPEVRRWRGIAIAHGADGIVLDGGLEGARVHGVLASATHGRWVLARTDWEDTFALLAALSRTPAAREAVARRLRAVVQQRLVAAPAAGTAGEDGAADVGGERCQAAPRAVFEVLVPGERLRAAILAGAAPAELRALALREGFRLLEDRVREGVANGRFDPTDAARALA